MTMLAAALEYAAKGLPVFPCDFNKHPLKRGGGFKDATDNVDHVKALWDEHPYALIGMPTGPRSGFWALDIDGPAHGVNGLEAWDKLTRGRQPVVTRWVETAHGGLHLYFRCDPNRLVTNRRGSLPPGIDVRGDGGYIIVPPSEIPDGGGRWFIPDSCETDQIADAPDWLYELLNAPQTTQVGQSTETFKYFERLDCSNIGGTRPNGNYLRAALASELAAVAGAVQGGRNERLNRAAFSLGQLVGTGALPESEVADRLFGAAQDCGLLKDDGAASVKATIASGLKAGKAKPREIPGEIERSGDSLRRINEKNSGRFEFPSDTDDGASASEQAAKGNQTFAASRLIWYGDAKPTPPPELVEGTLPQVGLAIIAGPYGFAKTFVAADGVSAVILGGDFAGKPVLRCGGVIWLAAEGENEIEARISAAIEARGGDPDARQPFARQAHGVPSLTAKDALAQLEALAAEATEKMKADFGVELALIVIDTLSAAAGFDDENSAAETQKVMNTLAALARKIKALVAVIDHHGKTTESGVRGSSAKSAAADAILACLGDRDPTTGEVSNRRLAVAKVRSGPTGRVVTFDLQGTVDGSTCVVRWNVEAEAKPAAPKARTWPKGLRVFKDAFDEALGSAGKRTVPRAGMPEILAVDREAVRDEFLRRYTADTSDAKRKAFLRCERDAIDRGFIRSVNVGPDLARTLFWSATDA